MGLLKNVNYQAKNAKDYKTDGTVLVAGDFDKGKEWEGVFNGSYFSEGKKAEVTAFATNSSQHQ